VPISSKEDIASSMLKTNVQTGGLNPFGVVQETHALVLCHKSLHHLFRAISTATIHHNHLEHRRLRAVEEAPHYIRNTAGLVQHGHHDRDGGKRFHHDAVPR